MWWAIGEILLRQLVHIDGLFLSPTNFESPPRIVGYEVLLLCLDGKVRDWENIQLPSVKMSAGFNFSQEMSTSAINFSVFPIQRHSEHCNVGIVLHDSNSSTLSCHESSSVIPREMCCRHYFVAYRIEDLVDECDSRSSSGVREHGNFSACFTTSGGNPDTLKSMSIFSRCVNKSIDCSLPTGRSRSNSICVYVFVRLRLCVYLNVQQTNWYFSSQVRNVCRFPQNLNGTFVLS